MIRTILAGALLCVLTIHAAEAKSRRTSLQNMQTSVGCSDPVMRPCGGRLKIEPSFEHHPKPLKIRHYSRKSDHLSTTSGLSRVLAEGAGRVVNWAKPRAWCGWWMRRHLGVANPAGNLARWWAGYGSPAHGPHVGVIVVWGHHVGKITGRTADGRWIVKSGNDGHRVRERPRSVADAIAFRWPA